MRQPLISIIIPVYNAEHYLRQCIDKVIQQNYKNLEIICLNDGSQDNSLQILDEYAAKDSRIRIISQKNAGVSEARNRALQDVSGEYVMFIDADDWIDLNTCELVVNIAIGSFADLVLWPYVREYPTSHKFTNIFDDETIIFSETEIKNRLHRRLFGLLDDELRYPETADSLVTVWGKLYKTSIIKKSKAKFIDTKLIGSSEDALFNIDVILHAKKAVYTNRCRYHYRKDNMTAFTKKYRSNLVEQWDVLFNYMADYIIENNLPIEYNKALNNRISLSIIGLGLNEVNSNEKFCIKLKKIKTILNNSRYINALKDLHLEYFPIHWKVLFLCGKMKSSIGIYLLLQIINQMRR